MDLVTGGAGFIGSHLVDALVNEGKKVKVLDNFSSGRMEFLSHHDTNDNVEIINADLLDLVSVIDAMKGVEFVHHLAANPDIRLGTQVTDTDLKQGTLATYNVLEAMRINEVGTISFASSSAIYGEAQQMPTSEDYGPIVPISLYGASKLGGEALISAWVGTFGIRAYIHRFANIVGPRGTHGVIFDFIHKLKTNPQRLEVLGNGLQEKSYMEVGDCVDGILHVIDNSNEPLNLFNLGSHDTSSVTRIAEIVIEETGCGGASIEYTGGDRGWAGDIPKAMLSIDKMLSTGYDVRYNSEEAIRHTAKCLIKEIGL